MRNLSVVGLNQISNQKRKKKRILKKNLNCRMKFFPRTIFLNITDVCNLKCKHCIKDLNDDNNKFMTKSDIFSLINELSKIKTKQIILTGGEPFLHKDFWKILRFASQCLPSIYVDTNGILLSNMKFAKRISKYANCHVQISMDGIGISHDFLRGGGSFEKTWAGIGNLIRAGKIPVIATVMHKYNYLEIEKMYSLLESKGIRQWRLMTLMNQGRAKKNFADISIGIEEWKKIIHQLESVGKKIKVDAIAMFSFIGLRLPFLNKYDLTITGCEAGKFRACISSDGMVTPCSMLADFNCGNIFKDKFIKIWNNSRAFQLFRNYDYGKIKECANCKYVAYCKGGCHGTALQHYDSIYKPDPRCPKQKRIKNENKCK